MSQPNISKTLMLLTLFVPVILWANNVNTGGQKGIVRALTVETHGVGGINTGIGLKYDLDMYYAKGPSGTASGVQNTLNNNTYEEIDLSQLGSGVLFFSYGLANFWDFSLDLPVYHDKTGWGPDHTAFGNLELTSKLRYPFKQEEQFINQAYFLKVVIPTGAKGSGYFPRHAYYIKDLPSPEKDRYTSGDFVIIPQMIWSAYLDRLNSYKIPIRLHANFGGAIHSTGAIIAAFAGEFDINKNFTLFLELSGESRVSYYLSSFSFQSFDDDVFILTPGIKYKAKNGLHTTLGFDIGLADDDVRSEWLQRGYRFSTKGTPQFGVNLTVGWSGLAKMLDSDKDGVPNEFDKCPHEAEDIDKFQDKDGCPDIDNDKDGVLDAIDKCPNTFTEVQGCPVVDVDNDGIKNKDDNCPEKAEDMDGFEDTDGCPDEDNDKDKIFDQVDKCPQKAEDEDGFEDEDGCPDLDNDGDGFLDTEDQCPNNKGIVEKKGCPKADEIKRGKPMLLKVSFQTSKAVLNTNSFTILDQVIESLNEWKEIKLEIQGYTDNVGGFETNKRLSQDRAESVKQYMVSKGISSDRLNAIGYGPESPIADNKTAEGRERNRRVELKRID